MMKTPPPTTLSTPSPTEHEFPSNNDDNNNMPPTKPTRPIYVIVATSLSPPLGIGIRGSLPWPQIRTDMAFFRRVTSATTKTTTTTTTGPQKPKKNVVIMGRKTWDSIPMKFRPLPGRINVILTRGDYDGMLAIADRMCDEIEGGANYSSYCGRDRVEHVSITRKATLESGDGGGGGDSNATPEVVVTNSLHIATNLHEHDFPEIDKYFCIGGAEIYKMVLGDKGLRDRVRVLQTAVVKLDGGEFECDTFFPDGEIGYDNERRLVEQSEVEDWVGFTLPQGKEEWVVDGKAGVKIRVLGWEGRTAK